MYGVLGLYVLTITPSSFFLECFFAATGAAAVVSASTEALIKETFFTPSVDEDSTQILFPLKKAYHELGKHFDYSPLPKVEVLPYKSSP